MLGPSKVTDRKKGAFRDWKEDDEQAELFLPLPANTTKKEVVCTITSTALHVRHVRLGKTLLRAEPLAGLVNEEESTWYLQGTSLLIIVLAKQTIGETKSDRYWGGSLAAEGGLFECYKSAEDVEHARGARERLEAKAETERKARATASEKALREKELEAEAKEAKELRKRRAREEERARAAADLELDANEQRRRRAAQPPNRGDVDPWYGDWSWIGWGLGLATIFIMIDVFWNWRMYFGAPSLEAVED